MYSVAPIQTGILSSSTGQRSERNFNGFSVDTSSVDHRLFFGKHSETQRYRKLA